MAAKKGDKHPRMIGNKFALNNDGGRPSFVDENDLPALGDALLIWANDKFNKLLAIKKKEDKMPFFLLDFAREHNLSKWNLSDYAEANKEFSYRYKAAKGIIKQMLICGGLKGWWNPMAFVFVAKNETDMKDRQELTGADGQPLFANEESKQKAREARKQIIG